MIQTMLNTVEIDIALVSGLILLGVATVVSTIGLTKIGNENTKFAMKRSDGHYLISVASYISLIAFVPLTVYVTTRVFPTLFQQFVSTFLILAVLAYKDIFRKFVLFVLSSILSIILTIVTLPFSLSNN